MQVVDETWSSASRRALGVKEVDSKEKECWFRNSADSVRLPRFSS